MLITADFSVTEVLFLPESDDHIHVKLKTPLLGNYPANLDITRAD